MAAIAVAALMVVATPGTTGAVTHPPEGCQAVNPGQETCTFTVAADAESPVSGAAGPGSWVVTVKRPGEKKPIVLKPDAGGGVVEFTFQQGDKVTAKALSPGTFMTAGFVQP